MISVNYNIIKELYAMHDLDVDANEINIFGIRDEANQSLDVFNDVIGIYKRGWVAGKIFQATTDPGRYYTLNKQGGAAHLCEGFWKNIWMVGIHAAGTNFAHEALVQRGNKVRRSETQQLPI